MYSKLEFELTGEVGEAMYTLRESTGPVIFLVTKSLSSRWPSQRLSEKIRKLKWRKRGIWNTNSIKLHTDKNYMAKKLG